MPFAILRNDMKYLCLGLIFFLSSIRAECFSKTDTFETLHHKDFFTRSKEFDEKQLGFLNRLRANYEAKKEKIFTPATKNKIPRIIHFIWIGPKSFPIESIKNIQSWIDYHPGWTFKLWTDRPRLNVWDKVQIDFVDRLPLGRLKPYYDRAVNLGEKSDYLRYTIIKTEGGLYIDHDMDCYRNIEPLLNHYDFVAGALDDKENNHFIVTVPTSIFAAIPHHPIMEATSQFIVDNAEKLGKLYSDPSEECQRKRILALSFGAITRGVETALNQNNNSDMVVPTKFFYNLDPQSSSIFAQHLFGGKWIEQDITKLYQKKLLQKERLIKRNYQYLSWLVVVILLLWILWFARRKKTHWLLIFLPFALWSQAEENRLPATLFYMDNKIEKTIPKKIHFVDLDSHPITRRKIKNICNWIKKHPRWAIFFWTPHKIQRLKLLVNQSEIQQLDLPPEFWQTPNLVEKEMLTKLSILRDHGGICLSCSQECVSSLDEFIADKSFMSTTGTLADRIGVEKTMADFSLIASSAYHPLILTALEQIRQKWDEVNPFFYADDEDSLSYKSYFHILKPFNDLLHNTEQLITSNVPKMIRQNTDMIVLHKLLPNTQEKAWIRYKQILKLQKKIIVILLIAVCISLFCVGKSLLTPQVKA